MYGTRLARTLEAERLRRREPSALPALDRPATRDGPVLGPGRTATRPAAAGVPGPSHFPPLLPDAHLVLLFDRARPYPDGTVNREAMKKVCRAGSALSHRATRPAPSAAP
ncbi:hypothetical protein ABZ371_14630 [Streptomyces sp. NPDC005899]|uniref:hypothetical protein n=1 Tax=Streptomyces sp. NPDC005899 TaxID=3155716 RepID=UPI0033ECB6C7